MLSIVRGKVQLEGMNDSGVLYSFELAHKNNYKEYGKWLVVEQS
jgi:hypothetical protein